MTSLGFGPSLSLRQRRGRVALADIGMTIYADFDPAVGVTQTGGLVSAWADAIGGLTVSQATSTKQPIWAPTSYFGAPGITHDGIDDFLEGLALGALPIGAAPGEIWALVDQQATDATTRRLLGYGGTTLQTSRTIGRNTGGNANFTTGDGAASPGNTVGGMLLGRHFLRYQVGANQSALSMDFGADATAAANVATGTGKIRIGSHTLTTAAQFWQGVIGRLLFTAPLSPLQAALLADYLRARLG